jgi:hypothetical protein
MEIEALVDSVDVVIEKPRTAQRMARWSTAEEIHDTAILYSECFLPIHCPLSYAIRPILSS